MAMLGDLKARIVSEMNRDDLLDDLATALNTAISDAIGNYANERFWFNESRTVGQLTAGQEYTPLPSGVRTIDQFYLTVGGVRYLLAKREMDEIENLYTVPQTGQPTDYAIFGTQARLWPTPNIVYPTIWLTVSDVTPPIVDFTDNTQSNYWTNDGQWLISQRAKTLLYRDTFKDPINAGAASASEREAYGNLKGESNRRIATGRIRPGW